MFVNEIYVEQSKVALEAVKLSKWYLNKIQPANSESTPSHTSVFI